jgi:hypothetical protein
MLQLKKDISRVVRQVLLTSIPWRTRAAPVLDNPFSVLSFAPMGAAISPRGDMLKNRVPLTTQGRSHALDDYNFRR